VSAEIREEIEEILLLLENSGTRFTEIRIDAPEHVLVAMNVRSTVAGARVVPVPYRHSVRISTPSKLLGVVSFVVRLVRHRPEMLFSGFSMMKHRLAGALLRVPHLSYLRGVVFDPEVSVGISDKLRLGGLRRLIPHRLIATYWADHIYTIGAVNRRFLLGRGLPEERIHICGPVWLADRSFSETPTDKRPTAYFVTGAWEAHGRMAEHDAQLQLTRRLAREWKDDRVLGLRVHPRDTYLYEDDPAFNDIVLDRSLPSEFLDNLTGDDILISPLSTLAFEAMYLGRGVVFYADPDATKAYFHVYENLGISPITADDIVAGRFERRGTPRQDVFSPIVLDSVSDQLRA
jgi:hypothetical protein